MKKQSAKKKPGAKKSAGPHKKARNQHVVIDTTAKPGVFGRRALTLFDSGVQKEYARLAKMGVATVVVRDGQLIKGIPHRVGGRFVVGEVPAPRFRK